jgi:hypothetical protein
VADKLTVDDLDTHTKGRLASGDETTQMVLDAALAYVRNYCRWHVSPVVTEQNMSFDGPGQWGGLSVGMGGLYYASGSSIVGTMHHRRVGGDTLYLPTKHLLTVQSVVEDGNPLVPLVDYVWSSETGAVRKTNGQPWTANWASGGALGLQVSFQHGYTAEQAADWRRIVLAVADRMSMVRGLIGGFSTNIGPHRIGAYFGESRNGSMPVGAGWLDDLTGMIDFESYVRIDV